MKKDMVEELGQPAAKAGRPRRHDGI